MIYTLTLNPSLDYYMRVDALQAGAVNRSAKTNFLPGGKGINISVVLAELGLTSTAFGFLGGFTGQKISELLRTFPVRQDFVEIAAESRVNVKLVSTSDTEINAAGPVISKQELGRLFSKTELLKAGDCLVMSGNIPGGLDADIYKTLAAVARSKQADFVLDTEGAGMFPALAYRPLFVKPNIHELQSMFQTEIQTERDIVTYAMHLCEMGAQNVMVSMGGEGAVFVNPKLALRVHAPRGNVVSAVGAGDSMLAGLLYAYDQGWPEDKIARFGVACGSSGAFHSGLPKKNDIFEVFGCEITIDSLTICGI